MARSRLAASVRVPVGLEVSEADAARIDEVLMRPEFAGWTRAEWCREIIRSALRYYVGDDSPPDPGQAPTAAQPAPSEPPSPAQAPSPVQAPSPTLASAPAQPECLHPSDAWDYETGVCAACGASVWD
jgi:hypothetical protein